MLPIVLTNQKICGIKHDWILPDSGKIQSKIESGIGGFRISVRHPDSDSFGAKSGSGIKPASIRGFARDHAIFMISI